MPEKINIMNPREKQVYTGFLVTVIVLFTLATYISKFNPLEVLMEQGEFWEIPVPGFSATPLQSVAGGSRIYFSDFGAGSFVQFCGGCFCLPFRSFRQHFAVTVDGSGTGHSWPGHLSAQYPDTGLGLYPFFFTGHRHGCWLYCAAHLHLRFYDEGLYRSHRRGFR